MYLSRFSVLSKTLVFPKSIQSVQYSGFTIKDRKAVTKSNEIMDRKQIKIKKNKKSQIKNNK